VAVVLRGAAAFDVSRRPGRRFSVRAGDVEVVVVGTRFRVADVGGRIDVAVNEGTVEVWQGDRPQARLGAGARWSGARRLAPAAPVQATPVEAPPPPPRPRPAPAGRPAASAAPAAGAAAGAAAALFEQAARARREGRADAAAAAFDEIRRRHRRDRLAGVAAFQLGRIHLDGGAWRDALDAFRDALRLAPDAPYRAEVEAAVVQALDRSGDRAACARARDAYLAAHGEGPYARSVTRLCRR
jgi:transmembrane sensor